MTAPRFVLRRARVTALFASFVAACSGASLESIEATSPAGEPDASATATERSSPDATPSRWDGDGGAPVSVDGSSDVSVDTSPDVIDASTNVVDAADASVPAVRTLLFVNALTDLGLHGSLEMPVRLCFRSRVSGSSNPVAIASAPLPLRPVDVGGGLALPEPIANLDAVTVEPIVMNVASLKERGVAPTAAGVEPSCADLLSPNFVAPIVDGGGGALVEGQDYWALPEFPSGTFVSDRNYLLVLTGCESTSTYSTSKCGVPTNDAGSTLAGSLALTSFEIDDPAPSAATGALGVRFVNASPGASEAIRRLHAVGLNPMLIAPGDGGLTMVGPSAGGAGFAKMTSLKAVTGVTDDTLLAAASRSRGTAAPKGPLLASTLEAIYQNSYGANAPLPSVYQPGNVVVFVAVGDPEPAVTPPLVLADGGASDGGPGSRSNPRAFHFLGFQFPSLP